MKKPRTSLTLTSPVLSKRRGDNISTSLDRKTRSTSSKEGIRKAIIFAVGAFIGSKLGVVIDSSLLDNILRSLGI